MSTQTHSANWVLVATRPPRKYGETVGVLLQSTHTVVVAETSHSTHALIDFVNPPHSFLEV